MVANPTQLAAGLSGTLSSVLSSQPETTAASEGTGQLLEHIQDELKTLSLRHSEVQGRIQQVRHALLALVHVFGPEILDAEEKKQLVRTQNLSRRGVKVIDISRTILSRSTEWLTFDQIVSVIEKECPSTLAGFINPGVSVSNALRALERHGEVEVSNDADSPKWRWTGHRQQPGVTNPGGEVV